MSRGDKAVPERVRALVDGQGEVRNRDLVRALRVSPATAHRVLRGLVADGVLELAGRGPASRYRLRRVRRRFPLAGLDEDRVWRTIAADIERIRPLAPEEQRSLHYAATELINNAIDHSGGTAVVVRASFLAGGRTSVEVEDDGVGVYARIMERFGFASPADAIVQLEKGKLTTDPERHSGEGLFFSSKAVCDFRLEAQATAWIVDGIRRDSAIASSTVTRGTRVTADVIRGRTPRLADVFAAFTDHETLRFARTRTTVRLAAVGRELVSRSVAKRVLADLDKFAEVTIDFSGVEVVGQGFCDEVFRVFARAHPEIRLVPVGMDAAVAFMVGRAAAR